MIRVRPSFYDRFFCKASRCRHNCCIGWEIDVDPETASVYQTVGGAFGKELAEKITQGEIPHFTLCPDGRCPFLNEKNLCRIIQTLGEETLCDICALHPRFFNDFPGREETGLGLCCEETVRLLLEERTLSFIEESEDGGEERDEWIERLASLRGDLFDILSDTQLPFEKRLERCAQKLGMKLPSFEMHEWIHFFLLLERMEQSWGEMLNDLISGTEIEPDAETFNSPRSGKILSYLLYRHFLAAQTEEETRVLFAFAVLSVRLIAALDARDMKECDEHVRLFSAEIEYSDENMERICAKLRERFAFDDCI